jgi:hypothetical protein
MIDADQIATWGIVFRIGERATLSAIVIAIAVVATIGFWRTIQKVDFRFGRDDLSSAANVVLATPVFILLTLIGFAWVCFSNPVAVSLSAQTGHELAGGGVSYVGATPGVPTRVGSLDYERLNAEELVMSLNCVVKAAGPAVSNREADALVEARLTALAPIWPAEWGDPTDFRAWALKRSAAAPDPEARAAFEAVHPGC